MLRRSSAHTQPLGQQHHTKAPAQVQTQGGLVPAACRGGDRSEAAPEQERSRSREEKKRRSEEDLNVVPFNPDILIDWNGHINVEYSQSIARVLYTYSYLYKGPKKLISIYKTLLLLQPQRPPDSWWERMIKPKKKKLIFI